MRGTDSKSDSARVEPFPRVTRSSQVFIFGFEASEVFVEGVVVWTVHVVGQLERDNTR